MVLIKGNPTEGQRRGYRHALQLLAPKLFPAPASLPALKAGWQKTTSIVVVRHPLSRLASVYQQKLVNLAEHRSWGDLNRFIVANFRRQEEAGDGIPSPDEMVR